jgi:hypothetical protein
LIPFLSGENPIGSPVRKIWGTSVRWSLGRTAARLLLEEAAEDDGHQHRHVIFQPELVVRQSTRADDPAVQS